MEGRIVKMEMMLQTQNLCKYFRKQKAVNNVSLNIEKKQIYGLLGPNGAGKSTTLKMLTGMMKPTAGKIYFDGKLLDRKDEYYVSDWSGSDYHHSVHTFWKKNQKADAACIRRNQTNKGSKSGI